MNIGNLSAGQSALLRKYASLHVIPFINTDAEIWSGGKCISNRINIGKFDAWNINQEKGKNEFSVTNNAELKFEIHRRSTVETCLMFISNDDTALKIPHKLTISDIPVGAGAIIRSRPSHLKFLFKLHFAD
jgi:hypothetical protein